MTCGSVNFLVFYVGWGRPVLEFATFPSSVAARTRARTTKNIYVIIIVGIIGINKQGAGA